jgi:phosphatidylethanolamine/phosphatidyl-N-methylethanolamine N-methyltransferase
MADGLKFLGSFLKRPRRIGSLVPSSRALASAMLEGCPLCDAQAVVELGPGTGAITGPILERVGPETTVLAVELEERHVRLIAERFPRVHVCRDSAENLAVHLEAHRLWQVDCIVSGLPWANMSSALQARILEPVARCLKDDGVFVTFSYAMARWTPTARHFRELLGRVFGEVLRSRVVWNNFPPASVYRCRRPLLRSVDRAA